MPIPTINALSKRIASTDPFDTQANLETLDQLKALRTKVQGLHSEYAIEGLDGAILLLSFHVRTEGMGGPELMDVLRRIVQYVHHCMLQGAEVENTKGSVKLGKAHQMDPVSVVADMQLGEILLGMGYVNEDEITMGLAYGRDQRVPFGEALVQNKVIGEEQVREALSYQDACRKAALARQAGQVEPESFVRGSGPRVIKMSGVEGLNEGPGLKLMTDLLVGELLVRNGDITQEQLDAALLCQRASGLRLGEALVSAKACDWDQLEEALDIQAEMRNRSEFR